MIVKICDSCQKLLFEANDCAWVAVRERGALLLKKWQSGMADKATVSHFCCSGCALSFCEQWLDGKLVEPTPEVRKQPDPSQVLAEEYDPGPPPVEVRPPTAQEQAEQNSILRSLGI